MSIYKILPRSQQKDYEIDVMTENGDHLLQSLACKLKMPRPFGLRRTENALLKQPAINAGILDEGGL